MCFEALDVDLKSTQGHRGGYLLQQEKDGGGKEKEKQKKGRKHQKRW